MMAKKNGVRGKRERGRETDTRDRMSFQERTPEIYSFQLRLPSNIESQ